MRVIVREHLREYHYDRRHCCTLVRTGDGLFLQSWASPRAPVHAEILDALVADGGASAASRGRTTYSSSRLASGWLALSAQWHELGAGRREMTCELPPHGIAQLAEELSVLLEDPDCRRRWHSLPTRAQLSALAAQSPVAPLAQQLSCPRASRR